MDIEAASNAYNEAKQSSLLAEGMKATETETEEEETGDKSVVALDDGERSEASFSPKRVKALDVIDSPVDHPEITRQRNLTLNGEEDVSRCSSD